MTRAENMGFTVFILIVATIIVMAVYIIGRGMYGSYVEHNARYQVSTGFMTYYYTDSIEKDDKCVRFLDTSGRKVEVCSNDYIIEDRGKK